MKAERSNLFFKENQLLPKEQKGCRYMADLKLYTKNEKELDSLILTVKVFSKDIGMELGIEKCSILRI